MNNKIIYVFFILGILLLSPVVLGAKNNKIRQITDKDKITETKEPNEIYLLNSGDTGNGDYTFTGDTTFNKNLLFSNLPDEMRIRIPMWMPGGGHTMTGIRLDSQIRGISNNYLNEITAVENLMRIDGESTTKNQLMYGMKNIIDVSHTGSFNAVVFPIYNKGTIGSKGEDYYNEFSGMMNDIVDETGNYNMVDFPSVAGVSNWLSTTDDDLIQVVSGTHNLLNTQGEGDLAYGEMIQDQFGASTGGTQYGILIDLDDEDVENWGIYESNFNGKNYFESKTGFGTDEPEYQVDVDGGIRASQYYTSDGSKGFTGECDVSGHILVIQNGLVIGCK